ncbi:MAG TPA: S-layer homology domain-containing protein [Stenomitos sp.]
MKHLNLILTLAMTLAVGVASPAFASLASDTFTDVPDGHWAEQGVAEVAIKRDLMKGYADGTFRGEEPFTRSQFVNSMAVLLKELESLSKTSWKPVVHPTYTFTDVPADQKAETLRLTNDYGLFEGVPGISKNSFHGDQTVTRYEMAKIINNLMRLAEAKDVVRPTGKLGEGPTFSDVNPGDWAYSDMQSVSQRYKVMVGFPDGTFRGNEQLTRYQYAQAISQTVPMIRELIVQTTETKQEEKRQATGPWRIQEYQPIRADLNWANASSGGQDVSLRARLVGYPSSWFLMSETRLELVPGMGVNEELGVFYKMPFLGALQFQPYVGLQYFGNTSAVGFGGGAFLYWRPTASWGLYAKGGGAAGQSLPQTLWNGELGAEYHVSDKLAIAAGLSYWEAPTVAPAVPTSNIGFTFGPQFHF